MSTVPEVGATPPAQFAPLSQFPSLPGVPFQVKVLNTSRRSSSSRLGRDLRLCTVGGNRNAARGKIHEPKPECRFIVAVPLRRASEEMHLFRCRTRTLTRCAHSDV